MSVTPTWPYIARLPNRTLDTPGALLYDYSPVMAGPAGFERPRAGGEQMFGLQPAGLDVYMGYREEGLQGMGRIDQGALAEHRGSEERVLRPEVIANAPAMSLRSIVQAHHQRLLPPIAPRPSAMGALIYFQPAVDVPVAPVAQPEPAAFNPLPEIEEDSQDGDDSEAEWEVASEDYQEGNDGLDYALAAFQENEENVFRSGPTIGKAITNYAIPVLSAAVQPRVVMPVVSPTRTHLAPVVEVLFASSVYRAHKTGTILRARTKVSLHDWATKSRTVTARYTATPSRLCPRCTSTRMKCLPRSGER